MGHYTGDFYHRPSGRPWNQPYIMSADGHIVKLEAGSFRKQVLRFATYCKCTTDRRWRSSYMSTVEVCGLRRIRTTIAGSSRA